MNFDGAPGIKGAESVRGEIGLGQSECAAASAASDRPVGKRWAERLALRTGDGDEFRAAPSKSEPRVSGRFGQVTGIYNLCKSC